MTRKAIHIIRASNFPFTRIFCCVIFVWLFLNGCSTTKTFISKLDDGETQDSLPALALQDLPAVRERVQAPSGAQWAEWFNDDNLQDLIEEAFRSNPSIEAQKLAVEQADALRRISKSVFFPSLDLNISGRRSATNIAETTRLYSSDFSVGLTSAWEADIWRRNHAGYRATLADLFAQEISFEATKLSFAGRVAQTWFLVLEQHLQVELSQQDMKRSKGNLDIVERRYKNGLSSSRDLRLSRSSYESIRATYFARKQSLDEAIRALQVLIGRYPDLENLPLDSGQHGLAGIEKLQQPPAIDLGHPKQFKSVLEGIIGASRPDLVIEEAQILAAQFRYNQARRALLPTINISASIANNVSDISDLLDVDRLAGNLLSSLLLPIFRGGRIDAEMSRIEIQYRLAANSYARALLAAFQEVENALAAERYLKRQYDSLSRAAEEAYEAENLVRREYANGLATIFELLDAQRTSISARSQVLTTSRALLSNRASLHMALGGDIPDTLFRDVLVTPVK